MSDASDRQLRVLLAIGNPELERQLRTALSDGGCAINGRCLDGPSLVRQAATGSADVVLAATGLHRLTRDSLLALRETAMPVVLLTAAGGAEGFDGLAYALPAASDGDDVIAALNEAVRRGAVVETTIEPTLGEPAGRYQGPSEVLALVSGKGAPGTTTVTLGLAAALARHGKRVLVVDADLRGGSVGPSLDLDPRRGLAALGIAGAGRLQQLVNEVEEAAGFWVLGGVERPEAAARLAPERVAAAVAVLQEHFDTVLIDVGETISGVTSDTAAAFIHSAERLLLVVSPHLLGLWNAKAALRFVTESLGVPLEAVSAVVNRPTAGQYGIDDVERALTIRVAGVIPEDVTAAQRALAAQEPITAAGGRPARAFSELAIELDGATTTARERTPGDARAWRRWRRQPADGRN